MDTKMSCLVPYVVFIYFGEFSAYCFVHGNYFACYGSSVSLMLVVVVKL